MSSSSNIDPSKLKVVDLRNELSARGLDSKGVKAALVKRLQDALDEEAAKGGGDESNKKERSDTKSETPDENKTEEEPKTPAPLTRERRRSRQRSTDTSKPEPKSAVKSLKSESIPEEINEPKILEKPKEQIRPTPSLVKVDPQSPEKNITSFDSKIKTDSQLSSPKKEELQSPNKSQAQALGKVQTPSPVKPKIESPEKAKSPVKSQTLETSDVQVESTKSVSVKNDSKIDEDANPEAAADENDTAVPPVEDKPEPMAEDVQSSELIEQEDVKDDNVTKSVSRGKRKRSHSPRRSASPDGPSPRKRSRSPVRENEPPIDNEKVQLSWYDSDLHLVIDKDTFSIGKPMTEAAFGYVWAGVRASHGVNSGKVCYEVKIAEELDCEEFVKFEERNRSKDRPPRSDYRRREKDKKDDRKSKTEESKKEDDKTSKTESDKDEQQIAADEKVNEANETESDEKIDNAKADEKMEVPTADEKMEIPIADEIDDSNKKEEAMEASENNSNKEELDEAVSKNNPEPENEAKLSDESKAKDVLKPKPIPIPTYAIRIGWSLATSNLQLGEDLFSYGYDCGGKFATEKNFVDYGRTYGVGDVVGSYLDIQDEEVIIRYTVNGELQPIAASIPKSELPENFAFFPHIISRNYSFEVNFGDKEENWFPTPKELDGSEYLNKVECKIPGPTRPENRSDCEVLLMCGLPAVGKTHWVKEHVAANLDKRYNVIGNTSLLERMTFYGQPLKSIYVGRWSILVDRLQKSLNKLVGMAAMRRRNYIIDQSNVFPSAQRRKVRPFEGFKRRAVVIIVEDEEYTKRLSLQEEQDGKDVPESTILDMKAVMTIPEKCEWLEEVTYVGVQEAEAKELVKKYNAEGKAAGYGLEKRFKDSKSYRGRDYRGGQYRDRGYRNNRYDSPKYSSRPRTDWNRDRYDNRSAPRRDYRSGGDHRDRGRRDNYSHQDAGSYVRSRDSNQSSYRPSHGGHRSGGRGNWSGSGSWSHGNGSGGGWNQQVFGNSGNSYGNPNWGNSSGQKWNQNQGYGSYGGQNWNYYGQYGHNNWNQK